MPSSSGSQRFRRASRVRTSREYARSRAAARRIGSNSFLVELSRASEETRLGLVVSRKVGSAVVRNRVKRVVREWFRTRRMELDSGVDVVVIARPAAAGLSTREAWAQLDQLVRQKASR